VAVSHGAAAEAVISPNVPNVLTLLRILLVPVVVVALLDKTPHGDLVAAFVFAFASATDWVDGRLARSSGNVTTFGKLMDPIADKLLVIAALVSLVSLNRLAAWVAMVIIARELAVTMSRVAASGQGVVISAKRWGKVKTAFQVATIFLLIAVHGSPPWLDALVYVTVAVTLVSGIDYFFGLRRQLARASSHSRIEV
jgi:CDP-diacylglycerol--glycerol-3-phosphate 3-phosphatidyltransferase